MRQRFAMWRAMSEPRLLTLGRRLLAIAHNGLSYPGDPYDKERFHELKELAVELLSTTTGMDRAEMTKGFAGDLGHLTPRIDVRGACFDAAGRVLLVREVLDDHRWTLPGGWADVDDAPRGAVEREIQEESGFTARATKLCLVQQRALRHPPHPLASWKFFFLAEITGGAPKTSLETSGVAFYDTDALPEMSLGRSMPQQIARLAAHRADPTLPTEFD